MPLLRTPLGRWFLLCVAVMAVSAILVLRTPYTDATTTGTVGGFGFRMSGGCYLSVDYTVRGTERRFQTDHHERWCGRKVTRAKSPVTVLVHYDSARPEHATLVPRGRAPEFGVLLGGVGAFVTAVEAAGRRRRSRAAGTTPLEPVRP